MTRIALLILFSSALLPAQEHPAIATVKSFVEATRTGDAKTLDLLTAPQFFEISPLGEVDARAKFLGFYAPGSFDASHVPKSIAVEEVQVVDLGSMALLCWKETFAIETPAGPRSMAARCSGLLQKTPAGWKMVSRHVTGIRTPAPK
jgi:ketosteroid isomerase-like protein